MRKVILITGASSGFGRDTAETLAHAGHRVFAGVRDAAGRNSEVAARFRELGVTTLELDVTSESSVNAAVAQLIAETSGRLDVVINNAGVASAGVSKSFTPEQFRQVLDVNVLGVQRVLRATLPTMRRRREGLAINIGSVLGRVTFPFFGLYGASKFALEGMTDSYRYELSQLGVDVVLVQPSAYPTNMYATIQHPSDPARGGEYGEIGLIPGKMFETFTSMFSAEGAPDPHDVAKAMLKLVETPSRERPSRVVVGQPFGADAANAAIAPIQAGVVDALGLGALAGAARPAAA